MNNTDIPVWVELEEHKDTHMLDIPLHVMVEPRFYSYGKRYALESLASGWLGLRLETSTLEDAKAFIVLSMLDKVGELLRNYHMRSNKNLAQKYMEDDESLFGYDKDEWVSTYESSYKQLQSLLPSIAKYLDDTPSSELHTPNKWARRTITKHNYGTDNI
jgi:hypothetical protein